MGFWGFGVLRPAIGGIRNRTWAGDRAAVSSKIRWQETKLGTHRGGPGQQNDQQGSESGEAEGLLLGAWRFDRSQSQ